MSGPLIPLAEIEYVSLPSRMLREDSCLKFGYGAATYQGSPVQVANYVDASGAVVAQKLKMPGKKFKTLGNVAKAERLWGKHLWGDSGSSVTITEGEIDAMSLSQVWDHRWPVVSIASGAGSARKSIEAELEWLSRFEKVVLAFDSDEAGREAVESVVDLFAPGQCRVMTLPLKDANEMLTTGRGAELVKAFWDAKVYRPDGIVSGEEVWDLITKKSSMRSVPYPWAGLQTGTRGLRTSEIVTLCAGTGVGKSAICREIAYHLIQQGEKVGYIALEEPVKRTALGLIGIGMNTPVHLELEPEEKRLGEIQKGWKAISDKVFFHNHFGSIATDNLVAKIRYMAKAAGCSFVILDHISMSVSGIEEGDERRMLDNTMTKLRCLVQETGIGLIAVSHLRRPSGAGHEEGAATSLAQLRGSAGIGQLSDVVLGLERNLQADGDAKNHTDVRLLKDRFQGNSGLLCKLAYDRDTGRLSEIIPALDEIEEAAVV